MSISLKHTLLGLAAAAALHGVTASAAIATPPCTSSEQGGDYAFCATNAKGEHSELEASNRLEGAGGESVAYQTTWLGVKQRVTCKTDAASAFPQDSGKTTGSITFEGCKVLEPTNCKLPEAEEAKLVYGMVGTLEAPPGPPRNVTFTGHGNGEELGSITFENNGTKNCAIKGVYKMTGNTGIGCVFDTGIETFAFEHELTCVANGEKVKIGGNTASFTATAKLKTSTNAQFAILES